MRYIKSTFSTNVLQESLGPANIATTEAYLDCFEIEVAKNSNKILIWKYLIFFIIFKKKSYEKNISSYIQSINNCCY